jgi:DNA-binding transcriptional LysR family regulator
VFVGGATRALQALDETASRTRSAGRGHSGALSIGYVWSVAAGPANALLTEQRALAPEVEIELREQGVTELSAGLMDRSLDVAFLVGDAFPRAFDCQRLWREGLFFALGDDIGETVETGWSLLKDHPLLVSAWEDWTLYQRIADRSGGPRLEPHVHNCSREGVLGLAAAGQGIAIVPESTTLIPFPGVRFVRIDGEEAECTVCAAWLRENLNPALKSFVGLLRRLYPDKRRRGG